jgi:hypothetical protein
MKTLHGFYSKNASRVGSLRFRLADGSGYVETTAVFETKERGERNYVWDDKVYVGEVEETPDGIWVPYNPQRLYGRGE